MITQFLATRLILILYIFDLLYCTFFAWASLLLIEITGFSGAAGRLTL